ncbi:hypothetical protein Ancab_023360 [Ancistrocladus abbreviatus]
MYGLCGGKLGSGKHELMSEEASAPEQSSSGLQRAYAESHQAKITVTTQLLIFVSRKRKNVFSPVSELEGLVDRVAGDGGGWFLELFSVFGLSVWVWIAFVAKVGMGEDGVFYNGKVELTFMIPNLTTCNIYVMFCT